MALRSGSRDRNKVAVQGVFKLKVCLKPSENRAKETYGSSFSLVASSEWYSIVSHPNFFCQIFQISRDYWQNQSFHKTRALKWLKTNLKFIAQVIFKATPILGAYVQTIMNFCRETYCFTSSWKRRTTFWMDFHCMAIIQSKINPAYHATFSTNLTKLLVLMLSVWRLARNCYEKFWNTVLYIGRIDTERNKEQRNVVIKFRFSTKIWQKFQRKKVSVFGCSLFV